MTKLAVANAIGLVSSLDIPLAGFPVCGGTKMLYTPFLELETENPKTSLE